MATYKVELKDTDQNTILPVTNKGLLIDDQGNTFTPASQGDLNTLSSQVASLITAYSLLSVEAEAEGGDPNQHLWTISGKNWKIHLGRFAAPGGSSTSDFSLSATFPSLETTVSTAHQVFPFCIAERGNNSGETNVTLTSVDFANKTLLFDVNVKSGACYYVYCVLFEVGRTPQS